MPQMNEMIESKDYGAGVWKQVTPPPPGYFLVIRRSFDTGLHVLVFVRQVGDKYMVMSCIDHGTARPTETHEGDVSSPHEITNLFRKTCARWDEADENASASARSSQKQYYYAGEKGLLAGPVVRHDLFELISSGAITWSAQVWECGHGVTALGRWEPVLYALGFPVKEDIQVRGVV